MHDGCDPEPAQGVVCCYFGASGPMLGLPAVLGASEVDQALASATKKLSSPTTTNDSELRKKVQSRLAAERSIKRSSEKRVARRSSRSTSHLSCCETQYQA
jgi:hypothetical protein